MGLTAPETPPDSGGKSVNAVPSTWSNNMCSGVTVIPMESGTIASPRHEAAARLESKAKILRAQANALESLAAGLRERARSAAQPGVEESDCVNRSH